VDFTHGGAGPLEESIAPKIISNILDKSEKDRSHWIPVYTTVVSVIGFLIILLAFTNLPKDLPDFLLFAGIVALGHLAGVQLFRKSRSSITFGSALVIACIPLFGTLPSVIISTVSALMSIFNELINSSKKRQDGRASWLRRLTFNIGAYTIPTACAGGIYHLLGGSVGNVAQWSTILPLAAAGITDYLLNMGLVMGVITLQTGERPWVMWKTDHQWYAPASIINSTIGSGLIALTYEINIFISIAVYVLISSLSYFSSRFYVDNLKNYVEELEDANLMLEQSQTGLLKTLGTVIDAFDAYTFGHSTQVAVYAEAIAEKMGLSQKQREIIVKGALVHDIGKIGVMDAIIGKQGPLTDEEYRLVKQHPDIGAEILGLVQGFENLVPLVRYHHERWNGSGYPLGLKEEDIPLGARILAVADTVDAMFSDRPYRKSPTYDQVMEELLRCMGTQFDPTVVQAFFNVVKERGPSFFKNSAAVVDRKIHFQTLPDIGENVRYLKRSMLADVKITPAQEHTSEIEPAQD
jgi:putative nucleotidyltransferase with HDIG domain